MGGGKGGQTTTQRVQIPDFLRPFLDQQAGAGNQALGNLRGQLGDAGAEELVSPFNADQRGAFNLARDFTGQDGGLSSALNALQSTANGDFLFGGQGFDAAVDAAVRRSQPNILSTFGGAGRGTGGLAQTAIAQNATDAFAGQFGQERQRQLAAAGALPGVASQGFNLLSNAGAQQQQQSQRELTAPIQAQQQLLQAAGGPVPLQALLGRSVTQPGGSPLAGGLLGALGGGLSGSQIGEAVGEAGGPFGAFGGTLGGSLLGGLGGIFS